MVSKILNERETVKVLIQVLVVLANAEYVQCWLARPPQITSQFKTEYYITEDNEEALVLKCEASGQSPITYEWRKFGVTVVSSQFVIVDGSLGSLSIAHAQLQDFGTYQCFATNTLGTAAAAPFEVKRSLHLVPMATQLDVIREFKDKQPVKIKTTAYTYVTIPCTGIPSCEPHNDCMIEWKRGTGTTTTIKESKRIAVDTHGNLHFLYVEVGDESTALVPISCGLNHEAVKAFYKGRDVTLNVVPVTNPNWFKPLSVFAKDVKGLMNGKARLQCVFAGYPVPDNEWYRPDGAKIIANGVKYSYEGDIARRNLFIRSLEESDEGTYRCDASNLAGKSSAYVFLNVTSKPRFSSQEGRLENQIVPVGHDAKFACKLESLNGERRPTEPKWIINGVHIPNNLIRLNANQKYHVNADGTELTIKNVTRSDTCSIMCESGNVIFDVNLMDKFVQTYAGATLRIIDPIRVTALKQTHKKVNTPKYLSMAFNATTDADVPELFYKWNFIKSNNVTVESEDELLKKPWVQFFLNKRNLTIITENVMGNTAEEKVKEVVGIFKVHIFHQYESVNIEFEVTPYDLEDIIDVTINSSVACVNATVDIVCEAQTIVLTGQIAFEWKLNGLEIRPIQTSRLQVFYQKMSNIMYRSTLRIHAIDESDAGIIECTVVLGNNLNRSYLSQIQICILTIQRESLSVQNGGNTSVLCAISPICESGIQSVILYRDGEVIPKMQLDYFNGSVTLHLTNITRATTVGCKWMNQIKSVDILVIDPEMLECPIEHSHEILWNTTHPGLTQFQSCPRGFKGQASRYCHIEGHKGKWQKPNMDNCIRPQFKSILQRIKQIHDGILIDEFGKVLHEFANETKAVTKANATVATDLIASIEILATASNILSGREEALTSEEIEDFFSATDNIVDINTKDVWKELHENTGENKAAMILSIVSNVSDLVLKTLPRNGSLNIVKENLALQIRRTNIEQITFPVDILNFSSQVILPNSTILNCFNVSEIVEYTAAYYRTIATFLRRYKFERLRKEVGSDVISFSVNNNKLVKKLSPPLKLFFKTVETNFSMTECSYWDFTLPYGGNWATDGCEIVFTNDSATECRCDHMTSFAVLLSMIEINDEHHGVLTTMSIIGCTISIVCLVLFMICYALVWQKINYDKGRKRISDKDVSLVLLCLSLICAYLTFMLGIDRTQNKVICTAVAVLLHFLLLTVLCLMAAEGIIHAVLVTAVFQRPAIKKFLIPLSFVIPVVIVIISGIVTRLNGYGTDKFCWLSVDSGLIYAFFVPCVVVMSLNWIIACMVLKTLFSIKANENKTRTENLQIGIRSLFVMAPVFGLTWLFGLFSFGEHAVVFSYLFVIFNSLQGAVIFTVHVVLDNAVRNALKKRVFRIRKQQDFTIQSTDKTNTSNILKRIKKETKDTATFSSDDGAIDSNDVPLDVLHRKNYKSAV